MIRLHGGPTPNARKIAIALLEFGASHIGRVVNGMTVVVLQHVQNIVETGAGDKDQAFPVMNHAVGAEDCTAPGECAALLDLNAAGGEGLVGASAACFGERIDPQKISSALQCGVVARIGCANVDRERFHSLGLESGWVCGCARGCAGRGKWNQQCDQQEERDRGQKG